MGDSRVVAEADILNKEVVEKRGLELKVSNHVMKREHEWLNVICSTSQKADRASSTLPLSHKQNGKTLPRTLHCCTNGQCPLLAPSSCALIRLSCLSPL